MKQVGSDLNKMKKDVNKELTQINEKFTKFESSLENIEEKLTALGKKPSENFANDEIRSILEFIASQAAAANENTRANALALKKIDMLEKKFANFDNNFSK